MSQPATDRSLRHTDGCTPDSPPPVVPDHELLKLVGRGAYGEVWLGRNIMGEYRAVKVVYRSRFDHDRPYQREFEGIKKFEPVSRTHESQVYILHVGQNQPEGYFYYVMELADDQVTGQKIDPQSYQPETLKSRLHRQHRLAPAESVKLGLSLTTALAHLHQNGLVHRDIKPSNIIFINGQPKLADIGLVSSFDATLSYVGTLGFSPPEGPGTAAADIYSLGKVLYEAATGRDRQDFPDLPTELGGTPEEQTALVELNEVILKACDQNPRQRYQRAEAMGADLALLESGQSVARVRTLERLSARMKRVSLLVGLLFSAVLLFVIWQARQALKIQRLTAAATLVRMQKKVAEQAAETEAKQLLETLRLIGEDKADESAVQVLSQALEAQKQSLIGNTSAWQKAEAELRKPYQPLAQVTAPGGRILQIQTLTFGTNHVGPTEPLRRVAPYLPQELLPFLEKLGTVPFYEFQTAFPTLMVWLTALDPKTGKFVDCQDFNLEILSSNGEVFCGRRSTSSSSGPVGWQFDAFPRADRTLTFQLTFDEGNCTMRADVPNPCVTVPAVWSGEPLPQHKAVRDYEVILKEVQLRTNRMWQSASPYWFPVFELRHHGERAMAWDKPWWIAQDCLGNRDQFIPSHQKVLQFSATFYPRATNTEAAVLIGSSPLIAIESLQSNVWWNLRWKGPECDLLALGAFPAGSQVFLEDVYQTNPPAFMNNDLVTQSGWSGRMDNPLRPKRWLAHHAPVPSILVRAPRLEPDNLLAVRLRDEEGHLWLARSGGRDIEQKLHAFLVELPPHVKRVTAEFVILPAIKADFMVQLPTQE